MLDSSLGIQLHLRVGNVPKPVPNTVIRALISATVSLGSAGASDSVDGFDLTFRLEQADGDFALLRDGTFAPMTRVKIGIVMKSKLEVLVDGVVTKMELAPGNDATNATLHVKGEDIAMHLSLEERDASHPQQSDSDIVKKLVKSSPYGSYGLEPQVTMTHYTPNEQDHTPHQHETDLAYILRLARNHGFVTFCEPVGFDRTIFFWGPRPRPGELQPTLRMNTIGFDSVMSLTFDSIVLAPESVSGRWLDPVGRQDAASPSDPGSQPRRFAANPIAAVRTRVERSTAHLPTPRAATTVGGTPRNPPPPVSGHGKVDTVRYGSILRPYRSVGVAGAGLSYDGQWDVRSVTHTFAYDQCTQDFTLSREGVGTTVQRVSP